MSKESGTSELLRQLLEERPGQAPDVLLGALLEQFRHRGFGVFLLFSVLPSFIPVAFGVGAVTGSLAVLCGLQMMVLREKPWLPRFARDFGLQRKSLARFVRGCAPWFRRLEFLVKPRLAQLTSGYPARLTGLLVTLMGVALLLPVPLTNFLFAGPLLLLAIGIIEGDGALILLSCLLSLLVLAGFYFLGEAFAYVLIGWFQ